MQETQQQVRKSTDNYKTKKKRYEQLRKEKNFYDNKQTINMKHTDKTDNSN